MQQQRQNSRAQRRSAAVAASEVGREPHAQEGPRPPASRAGSLAGARVEHAIQKLSGMNHSVVRISRVFAKLQLTFLACRRAGPRERAGEQYSRCAYAGLRSPVSGGSSVARCGPALTGKLSELWCSGKLWCSVHVSGAPARAGRQAAGRRDKALGLPANVTTCVLSVYTRPDAVEQVALGLSVLAAQAASEVQRAQPLPVRPSGQLSPAHQHPNSASNPRLFLSSHSLRATEAGVAEGGPHLSRGRSAPAMRA